MLIDTHSHLNFAAFRDDSDEVIGRSLEQNTWLINVGTQFETSRRAVEMADQYSDGVYAAVGLHPIHLFEHHVDEEETSFNAQGEEFHIDSYKELVLRSTKVVAIGEFGLDYYRMPEGENPETVKKVQAEVVKQHLILAQSVGKSLMMHVRPSEGSQDAYEDLLKLLEEYINDLSPTPPPSPPNQSLRHGTGQAGERSSLSFPSPGDLPAEATPQALQAGGEGERERSNGLSGVIHSFNGTLDIAQEFVKRGFYIGLNGIITFDKTGRSEEVVTNTPLDKILLETDAPYLTPVPHRGKRNESSYVKFVAQKIGELKGIDMAEVEAATTANARKLFRI